MEYKKDKKAFSMADAVLKIGVSFRNKGD